MSGRLCVARYKASEGKEFFDEEGVKVLKNCKNCWNKYLARNLLPAQPAKRFSQSC